MQELETGRNRLISRLADGVSPSFPEALSHEVDHYFVERVKEIEIEGSLPSAPMALVAVGGYGRGVLCPGSDIDVMVLFSGKLPAEAKAFAAALLHPLWDLGLKVGHGVRTVRDCASLSSEDHQVLTSLMDARLLYGDHRVFTAMKTAVTKKALNGRLTGFARALAAEVRGREETHGDSGSLLEPNLKNGVGGLRDVHTVHWLRQAGPDSCPFLPEELAELRQHETFLMRVRTALHYVAGRKQDTLHFDLQRATATALGYVAQEDKADKAGRAVEFFLTRLHRAMGRIAAMREAAVLHAAKGRFSARNLPESITVSPEGLRFVKPAPNPGVLMDIFLSSAQSGIPISWAARRTIAAAINRHSDSLHYSRNALEAMIHLFLQTNARPAAVTLSRTGLLGTILPEFETVRHLVQFDDVHIHPVGRHTLETCAIIGDMLAGRRGGGGALAEHLPSPERLMLAALFHDLGKEEPNHELAGERIAREAMARFGFDQPCIDDVAFMVRNHLLLPATAARRDPDEPGVAQSIAETCVTPERLDMLQLLAEADAEATGPRLMGGWNRSLRLRLYRAARSCFDKTDAPEKQERDPTELRRAVADMLDDPDTAARIPSRALRSVSAEVLAGHAKLVRELDAKVEADRIRKPGGKGGLGVNVIDCSPGPAPDVRTLTVAAHDSPGLFATLAGCLGLHGLEILSADVFTWKGDAAVDVFTVSREGGREPDEDLISRLSSSIAWAMAGKLDVAGRLHARRNSLLAPRRGPDLPPSVRVDNASSQVHTLVEASAPDRTGLLHDFARAIADVGLTLCGARVSTISGRALDVFRVQEPDGTKAVAPARVREIEQAMLRACEE
ncbi:[protein-PII] uridylyltransferase [Salidesulfovibrio brasiliensis]